MQILWTFSIILESLCILPQLLLLRQTSVPTVLDSFYLVTLGSYRFFYLLNWIVRGLGEGSFDPIAVLFGIVQTALYVDFAWVYWTRQRVKLRGGGVVDGEDLSKSFLVRRFIGRRAGSSEEEEDVVDEDTARLSRQENGTIRPQQQSGRSWGVRGISVSADDTLQDADRPRPGAGYADDTAAGPRDAQIVDPAAFEDEDDDDADAPPPPVAKDTGYVPGKSDPESPVSPPAGAVVGSSAEEWQENTGK